MEQLIEQLYKMDISYRTVSMIQDKDGVLVARIHHDNGTYILKYFKNHEYRREIRNYKILEQLHIPTLTILHSTDCALLMEDIEGSAAHRLGMDDDLKDIEVAGRIAHWYRLLHQNGYDYVARYGTDLYDESDVITKENIKKIKKITATEELPVWKLFDENFDEIKYKISQVKRTLTYNDFYYTNLIVAKDKSTAFMYDYNLLGKGYVYSDIRNVCSSLDPKAKHVFLSNYGTFDRKEIIIDDVASVISTLYFACKRPLFPKWANEELETLRGNYIDKVNLLLHTKF